MHREDGGKTERGLSDTHDPQTGRFLPGNPGGPGRPRRAVERAVADAERGDAKARPWPGAYRAGKPTGDAQRKRAVDERAGADPLA